MHKHSIFLFVSLIVYCGSALASESGRKWTFTSVANLTTTESAYSDNWEGSEVGAFTWNFSLNSTGRKQLTKLVNNKNTLKLAFGQTSVQKKDSRDWLEPSKSTDLIDFESFFRLTLGEVVDPFLSLRFQSQFLDQQNETRSQWIDPILLTESIGISRVLLDDEARKRNWIIRFGVGFRQRFNSDVLVDSLADIRKNRSSHDGGLQLATQFSAPLAKDRLTYDTELTLTKALHFSEARKLKSLPGENYWKAVDVNWENIFTASITSYLMVNLYVQLLYDKEIDMVGRLKQTISLGLTYRLI